MATPRCASPSLQSGVMKLPVHAPSSLGRGQAPAPRARPTRPHGDATRQALLEAAGEVFAEQGFARGSSKQICALAGANLTAINYHFGSRENLYQAVLREAGQRFLSQPLVQLDILHGDARERLRGRAEPSGAS